MSIETNEFISKAIRITPLILISVLTSVTIVVDASEWYGALYDELGFFDWLLTGKFRGLAFALIGEHHATFIQF